jgi:hypothetical protein
MLVTRHLGTWLAYGVALMLGVSSISCILPPPGEELAPIENRPPRIRIDTLFPSATFGLPRAHCVTAFQATIGDPDADTLYYRVFTDYGLGGDAFPRIDTVTLDLALREASITFPMPLDRTSGTGTHTVELFVADRPFKDGQGENGRNLAEDGEFDSFLWPVEVNDNLTCPVEF